MSFIKRVTDWEQWPFQVLYTPVSVVWLYYIIRSRSIWFFTSSNPKLTFGGMDGEPKKEMYRLLPPSYIVPYFNVLPAMTIDEVLYKAIVAGIGYPLIVKPEVGSKGLLMRKIENEQQLRYYHAHIGYEYIVQQYVDYPVEVSLFYYRYPWEKKGTITGFLQKIPLQVEGDGVHTLEELILSDAKSKKRMTHLREKYGSDFSRVLQTGEVYHLSEAGNHNRGARFVDLKGEIDDSLVCLLDTISLSINDFFYGRYDIRCKSIADLKAGKNFTILEYNGCGAEPNHIYDTGYTLRKAYLEIIMHWKKLYTISRYNHRKGYAYWPMMKGFLFLNKTKRYGRIIKKLDEQIP